MIHGSLNGAYKDYHVKTAPLQQCVPLQNQNGGYLGRPFLENQEKAMDILLMEGEAVSRTIYRVSEVEVSVCTF